MSIKSGRKSKSKKEREKKRHSLWRNRDLKKTPVNKPVELMAPGPVPDENEIVSTHLRQSPGGASDQGADALEIVVYRTPRRAK